MNYLGIISIIAANRNYQTKTSENKYSSVKKRAKNKKSRLRISKVKLTYFAIYIANIINGIEFYFVHEFYLLIYHQCALSIYSVAIKCIINSELKTITFANFRFSKCIHVLCSFHLFRLLCCIATRYFES